MVEKIMPQPTDNNKLKTEAIRYFGKRWFCVASMPDSSICMADTDDLTSFNEILTKSIIAWVDYRSDDFPKDAHLGAQLGFNDQMITNLLTNWRDFYEDFKTEIGIKIPSIQINLNGKLDVQPHSTLLLLKRNLIFTIHTTQVDKRFAKLRRYFDSVLRKVPLTTKPEDRLTLLLIRIIDQNNDRNFEHLRQIEEYGDKLNKCMADYKSPREQIGQQIYEMKHALITYLDALWETIDVLNDLRYGDADLISDNAQVLDKVGLLVSDVNRQIGLAEHMSDVLASGLEVLQTIYNNQLQIMNNRLALLLTYLTVIGTAILVPNTLATVMGSSAFGMDSGDIGWYVALLVISTIAATWIAFRWVKKSGMIPKKMD